ncbi:MAG TPA: hypothetical protein PKL84_09500 [Candidatus Hydrogenedentes bacterium]|nr:hypothetical protein [Candidatus Hydrogenedentota bacterium]
MDTMKARPTLRDLLEAAIRKTGNLRQIERHTGVKRQSMMKFLRGRDLRLATAQTLMDYFGIEVRRGGKPRA